MSSGNIRDRTLVLRILVPRLEERLREKMREREEEVAAEMVAQGSSSMTPSSSSAKPTSTSGRNTPAPSAASNIPCFDLEGVSCEPTAARNKTLWNFHCDGATYPAKLVNLPCPVEIHKTVDHANYYKCQDVAQMLIVYEDDYALEEADEKPIEGFPSYYHSGLTPPMKRVVERHYALRDHKAVAPPRSVVADVEEEIMQLMEQLQKDEKGGFGGGGGAGGSGTSKTKKLPSLASTTKVLEEVEEFVVDYEPWMDDGGKQPHGIEFDLDDPMVANHPEIFLSPAEIRELKEKDFEARQEAERKRLEAQEKKEKKQNKRKNKQSKERASASALPSAVPSIVGMTTDNNNAISPPPPPPPVVKKKGIPSKKNRAAAAAAAAPPVASGAAAPPSEPEEMDQITQIAMAAINDDDLLGGDDDLFADLGLDFGKEEDDIK